MTLSQWTLRTLLLWALLAAGVLGTTEVTFAVASRDIGWQPGPLSWIAVLVSDAFLFVHLGCALLSLLPAYWWQRRGGSATGVLALAFGMPLSLVAVLAIRRGTESWDGLFLTLCLVVVVAVSFVGALLISFLVRPVEQPER